MTTSNVRSDQLPTGAGQAPEVTPIPAATVLLLRDDPFEVLMLRRHEKSTFVPGAWIFPGGAVEESDRAAGDGSELTTMRIAAAREVFEESGIWLGAPLESGEKKRADLLQNRTTMVELQRDAPVDLQRLVWFARWITPIGVPKRFDTYFFLCGVGRDMIATQEDSETVEVLWTSPDEALRRHHIGELPMVFPTLKNLELMARFRSSIDAVETFRGATIPTTRPILVVENGQKKIVLPSEP